MKKSVRIRNSAFASLLVLLCSVAKAQPHCQWGTAYGGPQEDGGYGITVDKNGNVYSCGLFYSANITFGSTTLVNSDNSGTSSDIYILKQDSCGTILWAKSLGAAYYNENAITLTTDKSGNLYVSGNYSSPTLTVGSTVLTNGGSWNIFLLKYNPSGSLAWAQSSDGDAEAGSTSIVCDKSGNIYMSGFFSSDVLSFGSTQLNTVAYYNAFAAKFDSTGKATWATSSGYVNDYDQASGIAVDATGNIYITGNFQDSISFGSIKLMGPSFYNIFLVKYNSGGVAQWAKAAGTDNVNNGNAVAVDPSGNVFLAGYFESTTITFGSVNITNSNNSGYSGSGFLAKFNAAGTALWGKYFPGSSSSYTPSLITYYNPGATAVATDTAGNVFVAGSFFSATTSINGITLTNASNSDTTTDIYLLKYNTGGGLRWAKSGGGLLSETVNGLGISPLSGVQYITGEFTSDSLFFGLNKLTKTGSGDIYITDAVVQNNLPAPHLCMVTVDTLSKYNFIYYERLAHPEASQFILLRETTSGVYKQVAVIPADSEGLFVDTVRTRYGSFTGDPNVSSNRYKLEVLDTSGNYGVLSHYHNSMFFQNLGSGNFSWTPYSIENEASPVTSYDLLKSDAIGTAFALLTSVPGDQTQQSDPNWNLYPKSSWVVQTEWLLSCNPTLKERAANVVNSSRSNIKNNYTVSGIAPIDQSALISVYPNPASGLLNIEYPAWISNDPSSLIKVQDYLGRELIISSPSKNQGKTSLDLSVLPSGLYMVEIRANNFAALKKVIVIGSVLQ